MNRKHTAVFILLGIAGWLFCFVRAWTGTRFCLWMALSLLWVWSWPGIAAVAWTLYDWATGKLEL